MDTFQELQKRMEKFVRDRNWTQFHIPKNLSMAIAVEAAELMEIYQWMENEESAHRSINDEQVRSDLEDEVADIIIYCLSLANATGIDLKSIIENKMRKNNIRFPPGVDI